MVNGAEAAGTRLNRLAADKKGNSLVAESVAAPLAATDVSVDIVSLYSAAWFTRVPEIPHIYGDLYRDGARSSGRCSARNGSLFTSSTIFA